MATKVKPKPAATKAPEPTKDEDIKPWPYSFPPMHNWLKEWLTPEAKEEARVAARRLELYPPKPPKA